MTTARPVPGVSTTSNWREPAPSTSMAEQRCSACRKLLCRADGKGRVEVVCPKCRTLNTFRPK